MTRSNWSYRNDAWWAQVAAILTVAVGLVGLVTASGPGGPAQVAVATVITAAGFEAKARWPRIPSLGLAIWTAAPAVLVNLRGWSEATMFMVVVATCLVVLTEPDRRIRLAVGAAGVVTPAFVAAVSRHPFGWPIWMMGIGFGWLSGEQMRRFRRLVDELEATRERLAGQAVQLERQRIAADLHDLVGHSLTVVLLYLTGARRELQHDPGGAADALREAEEIGRASLAEIRRNVAALRGSAGATMAPTPGAGDDAWRRRRGGPRQPLRGGRFLGRSPRDRGSGDGGGHRRPGRLSGGTGVAQQRRPPRGRGGDGGEGCGRSRRGRRLGHRPRGQPGSQRHGSQRHGSQRQWRGSRQPAPAARQPAALRQLAAAWGSSACASGWRRSAGPGARRPAPGGWAVRARVPRPTLVDRRAGHGQL